MTSRAHTKAQRNPLPAMLPTGSTIIKNNIPFASYDTQNTSERKASI
jgi:hypothetical protein